MTDTKGSRLRRSIAALICALFVFASFSHANAATIEYTVTASKVNLREEASTSSDIVAVIRQGETLTLIAAAEDGWIKVSSPSGTGYLSTEYACLTSLTGSDAVATVLADKLNIRSTPSQDGKILSVPRRGSTLNVLALTDGWLKVSYGGVTGYVSPEYVSLNPGSAAVNPVVSAQPTAAPTASVDSESDAVLKKGSRGDAVKSLQQKLITLGYLSGTADGIFGSDTRDAVKAFQRNEGIDDDGVAGAETLAALSSVTVVPSNPGQSETSAPITGSLLKKGSRGDAVKALQEKLIALGYLSGTADGYYGTDTVNAVKAFQRANSLTVDGVAGTLTLAKLNSASGTTGAANPTGATLLKYGDKGDAVKSLQTRLKELGYFNGTVGGNFGSITRDAVKAFQTAAGLTNDGIAGEKTLAAIYSSDAPKAEDNTLRAGDSGDAVRELQTRLKELGYLTGTVDGEFGAKTQAAVMAFQTAAGLSADGVAGQSTLNALYSDNAPAVSAPSNPGEGDTGSNTNSAVAEKIIATAKKYLGCKYVYACEDPPYFDCSGLTQYVFKQYGYSLLRTAYQQGYNDKYQKLTIGQLQMGDLVFFNTNLTDGDMCDHTGIYIGNGDFIHASSSAGKVVINNLNSGYYNQRFSWGRRILTD